jgi:hypothetical protein
LPGVWKTNEAFAIAIDEAFTGDEAVASQVSTALPENVSTLTSPPSPGPIPVNSPFALIRPP